MNFIIKSCIYKIGGLTKFGRYAPDSTLEPLQQSAPRISFRLLPNTARILRSSLNLSCSLCASFVDLQKWRSTQERLEHIRNVKSPPTRCSGGSQIVQTGGGHRSPPWICQCIGMQPYSNSSSCHKNFMAILFKRSRSQTDRQTDTHTHPTTTSTIENNTTFATLLLREWSTFWE